MEKQGKQDFKGEKNIKVVENRSLHCKIYKDNKKYKKKKQEYVEEC